MEPNYTWVRIGNHGATESNSLDWYVKRSKLPHILDIMGAPITDNKEYLCTIKRWIQSDTRLCISGELKMFGDGCPASNYRYKKDKLLNDNVINNYLDTFYEYSDKTNDRPIFVTTIPRDWRLYSWYITDEGKILKSDKLKDIKCEDLKIREMLESFNITENKLIKIRESCRGAKYNTYLIDMISFLYQMKIDDDDFYETYNLEYRKVDIVEGGSKVDKWTPDKDTNYLYFNKTKDSDGFIFYTPNNESVYKMYELLDEAISMEENKTKERIRNHIMNHRIDRWTDFDANDTDDAFTILMMMHSFKGSKTKVEVINTITRLSKEDYVMNEDEKIIYDSLNKSMESWFNQLEDDS